jgi:hypothetical protein
MKIGFKENGRRIQCADPEFYENAEVDLWNDRLHLRVNHRGEVSGSFHNPNPQAYAGRHRAFYLR